MSEDKINIQFPDGNKKSYQKGIRPKDIIEEIGSQALKQKAVVAQVNGQLVDLNRPIEQDTTLIVPPVKVHEERLVSWESVEVPPGTRVTPLYTVRWSPDPTPEKSCSPIGEDWCVEVHTPSPVTVF